MRKIVLSALLAATGLAGAAHAQSVAEIRRDDRDVQQQRRDLRDAQRHGDGRDVREARADLRDARQERREDWRDYREAHRDTFRSPAYVGPRGYRYRPVANGYRLQPAYYGSRYVIADPYRYRLSSPGANRWVRYGNDVLLVDPRSGRVVTVYERFFY